MHLKASIDQNKIPIICPIEDCKAEIGIGNINQLLTEDEIDRFYNFSLKLAIIRDVKKFERCYTKTCDYVFFLDESVNRGHFECPSCDEEYCLNWESYWHEGTMWNEYQKLNGKGRLEKEDKEAIALYEKEKMKKCPNCKMWVKKVDGCDAISCRCGIQFWYRCGTQCEDAHNCQCSRN